MIMSNKYDIIALQKFADEWATYWWKIASQKLSNIGLMPKIIINTRLTSTAGRAFHCGTKIDLSAKLMTENPDYFARDTIPHEIAHIIADKRGSKGHDAIWRDTCKIIGFETTRCHSMQIKRK